MKLQPSQIEKYQKDGYLFIEHVFTKQEVGRMLAEMNKVIAEDCPRRILEKRGQVRSFFSPDADNELFAKVVRSERLVLPSVQLIGSPVYIHQTKLNCKFSMVGDWWEWHQDYTFWKKDDGMPAPDVLTAMIFLNDVNEFNGPMFLVPGSHTKGSVDVKENKEAGDDAEPWFEGYRKSTQYMSALTADLKYTLEQETIEKWVKKTGLYSAKGSAGSVLFFHGNVFHSSSNNMSPWDRHTFLVTYNSIVNPLADIPNPRPEFIASRNFKELIPAKDSIA